MKKVESRKHVYQDELDVLDDPQALLRTLVDQAMADVRKETPVRVRQWTVPERDVYVVAASAVILEPTDYGVLREALDVLIDALEDSAAQGDNVDPKRWRQAQLLRQELTSSRFGNVVGDEERI